MLSIEMRSLLLLAYTANAIQHNGSASGHKCNSLRRSLYFSEQVIAVDSCANPLLGGAGVGFLRD
jgi:hypothetical protein